MRILACLTGAALNVLATLPRSAGCWGIYRELAHSPGRESDDAQILRLTAQRLVDAGF